MICPLFSPTHDAGEFSCTIGNEKCSAKLVVEEPKVNFVAKLPAATLGTVGQDVRITVKLTNANASAPIRRIFC